MEVLSIQLACVESTRMDHANLVVREHSVRLRQLILRHMAGDAIAGRHLADCLGRERLLRSRAETVTRQAFGVIGAWFVNKRPMRVVTGHASNPSVAVCSVPRQIPKRISDQLVATHSQRPSSRREGDESTVWYVLKNQIASSCNAGWDFGEG